MCYRYTNPLAELLSEAHDYYNDLFRKVKTNFSFFAEIKLRWKLQFWISTEKQDFFADTRFFFLEKRRISNS